MNQQQAEEFVRVWQMSKTAIEAGEKLGISAGAARSRAARMRKRGVPLKMGVRGKSRIQDYGKLKELAESLLEKN